MIVTSSDSHIVCRMITECCISRYLQIGIMMDFGKFLQIQASASSVYILSLNSYSLYIVSDEHFPVL